MKTLRRNYITKLGVQSFLRLSTSVTATTPQRQYNKTKSTVDFQDVAHHSKFSEFWWDPNGKFKVLHAMNPLRIKFVRDGLANAGFKETNPSRPLEGIKILDIGCGGGLLSEPLARLGANVTGLDASKELLSIAKQHAELDKDISTNLKYVHSSIEDFSEEKKEEYDAVVASEIIEHVIDQELFLKSCVDVVKPRGPIFITTINRTLLSWFIAIIAAEYILHVTPIGTHDWNKFITPDQTRQFLEKYNCKTKLILGSYYNPTTNKWILSSSTAICYALHAVKQETCENNKTNQSYFVNKIEK